MTISALQIDPDGKMSKIELQDEYKELSAAVGGLIEAIYSDSEQTTFWVNEEGKLMGLPVNKVATDLLWELNPAFAGRDFLVGTVVLTGGVDAEGNTLSISDEGVIAAFGTIAGPLGYQKM